MPYPGQIVADEGRHARQTEQIRLLLLHKNITEAASVQSQIQHSSQVISVCELFRKLFLKRSKLKTGDRRFCTKQGSLRPEYRDLTLR